MKKIAAKKSEKIIMYVRKERFC